MSTTPKVLLVFCDGTGMDGDLASGPTTVTALPGDDTSNAQQPTNVLRLSRAVREKTTDGRLQIVFYQSGVGTEADFDGNSVAASTALQAFGTSVASKIRDAYAFVAQNFIVGDEICVFGFSRGAYTARKLTGLIDRIGLLEREKLGYFFDIWKDLADGKEPDIPSGTRTTTIKCVGVWDTVGSVFSESILPQPIKDALSLNDTALPASIEIALHAMALHENRQKFIPTPWTKPDSTSKQVFKQIWFPGAHSDVGGGYAHHELADIGLFWMAGEIKSFINLDLDFLQRTAQISPDPWGTSQPHNAFDETEAAAKVVIGNETRLEAKLISRDDLFHQSVLQSPTKLKDPLFMITLDTLRKAFGAGWQPTCPDLNDFEEQSKVIWDQTVLRGAPPGGAQQEPVKFENPFDLFGLFSAVQAKAKTVKLF